MWTRLRYAAVLAALMGVLVLAGGCGGSAGGGADVLEDPAAGQDGAEAGTPEADGDQGQAQEAEGPGEEQGADGEGPEAEVVDQGPWPVACSRDDQCQLPCAQGTCLPGGACVFIPRPGACALPIGDGSQVACFDASDPSPDKPGFFCAPGLAQDRWSGAWFYDDVEKALPGVYTPLDTSGSGIGWHRSTRRSAHGAWSWYLGDEASGSYQAALPVDSSLALTLSLPEAPLRLRFDLWLETEGSEGYDALTVRAEEPGGAITPLFDSQDWGGTTGGVFRKVVADLAPLAGRTVTLRFRFATGDAKINLFEGAYLDQLELSSGACSADAECDDLNPCTAEGCGAEGRCSVRLTEDCCVASSDCDDHDLCTTDSCSDFGGHCQHTPLEGCCQEAADCDDGDACTLDLCPVPGEDCRHRTTCCQANADCLDWDPCSTGLCQEGQCRYVDTCCHADIDCDDGELCTKDVCGLDGACQHKPAWLPGCCVPEVFTEDFDGPEQPFTFSGGAGEVGWHHVTDLKAKSAPGALYYGDPAALTYDADGAQSGEAVSPPVTLPLNQELTLSLNLWQYTESGYDEPSVLVREGGKDHLVWSPSYSTAQKAWIAISEDLTSLGGATVQLVLAFEADASFAHEGVYVDDLQVRSSCTPRHCTKKADCPTLDSCRSGACELGVCLYSYTCCLDAGQCDDDDPCTTDSCELGHCQHDHQAGCCADLGDCEDHNPCTQDACPGPGQQCNHQWVEDCCTQGSDCDDGNACTRDLCQDAECIHQDLCCADDAQCDDGDACTSELCGGGLCQYQPLPGDGCCSLTPLDQDFDGTEASGLEVDPPVGGVGWRVVAGLGLGGSNALYYGDPSTWDFDNGAVNHGSARFKAVSLPALSDLTLGFKVYGDTYYSTSYDVLEVVVHAGDASYLVWSKPYNWGQEEDPWDWWDWYALPPLPAASEWLAAKADLSAFAGRTVDLEFAFDTVDSYDNDTLGVLVDDLRIDSTCKLRACTGASACADGLDASEEVCQQGSCTYSLQFQVYEP
jgi:hypothetical protein